MSTVDLEIKLENVEEVKRALERFHYMFKEEMYSGLQRIANNEERILKATTGFEDRTGHLRRSLFATATYNPLGIEMGSFAKYAIYAAMGHGTWRGNWWNSYIREMTPRVTEGITDLLKRLVNKWNQMYKEG